MDKNTETFQKRYISLVFFFFFFFFTEDNLLSYSLKLPQRQLLLLFSQDKCFNYISLPVGTFCILIPYKFLHLHQDVKHILVIMTETFCRAWSEQHNVLFRKIKIKIGNVTTDFRMNNSRS